jgi:hypothetical protein
MKSFLVCDQTQLIGPPTVRLARRSPRATWSASVLRVPVIFKGGTSLPKAYSIIQRFSEDVDVLVLLPVDDTKGGRDRILKSLVERAHRSTLRDPVSVTNSTTTGAKRGARF